MKSIFGRQYESAAKSVTLVSRAATTRRAFNQIILYIDYSEEFQQQQHEQRRVKRTHKAKTRISDV